MPPRLPKQDAPKLKAPRCHRCDKRIHVPEGWSRGAATRRHYWSKHRTVMRSSGTRGKR
jgi:hypothetical protein